MDRTALRLTLAVLLTAASAGVARAQSYGVEFNNSLMPASGAMGGASAARPQDVTSAINGNPAALTQFRGTQFVFGGAWAESTFNLNQTGPLPLLNVAPYGGKSTAEGGQAGNIGVSQELSILDIPMTMGIGFVTGAGGAVDFRQFPASNGTNTSLLVFQLPLVVAVELTENLSIGAGTSIGTGVFDGPFVGIGGMTVDYGLRGLLGANYNVSESTTAGIYYQSRQHFRFDHAIQFQAGPILTSQDIRMDLPENIGLGIANTSLLDGQLLLAADLLYKRWSDADLFRDIYNDQWVLQLGSQYSIGRYRLRSGYTYAENPLNPTPGLAPGGILPPGGVPAVRYTQALLAVANHHRISGGMGVVDVLPGVDMDLMAGGMFRDTEQLGPLTTTSLASYWIGFGMTWRFGCGNCENLTAGGTCFD